MLSDILSTLVRTRAAQFLLEIRGVSFVPTVRRMIRENHVKLVEGLTTSLAKYRRDNPLIYDTLVEALEHKMQELGEQKSRKIIQRCPKEVVATILGLEKLGDSRAIPIIEKVIDDTIDFTEPHNRPMRSHTYTEFA